MNDVMPGSDELGFLVILNKSSEYNLDLDGASSFFGPERGQSSLWTAGCASAFVGSDETVSREKLCVSLLASIT